MDYRLALMTGVDIPVPECGLTLHQPTIQEISMIGEEQFFIGVQVLCVDKNMYTQGEIASLEMTNFQIFMMIMNEKTQRDKKTAVFQLLGLLFPGYNPMIPPRALLLNKNGENSIIDENNFEFLQAIFSQLFCLSASAQDSFNPGNDAAKKIADKLMRARQRVAAQKKAENGNGSVFAQYLSILTVGLESMSLSDLAHLTMYQLYDLVERYTLYVNWDLDIRQRLAGGKPDSSPDNWMKIIH